ncbi:MAG: hypothetical protein IPL99_26270 [Candidatus Competibacteraceae bacterium]|nr:hypothetical protein [Candidatus Competibacteraceae bacterium]
MGTLDRLERALVLYLIIAWRILYLVTWGLGSPEPGLVRSCSIPRKMAGRLIVAFTVTHRRQHLHPGQRRCV